MLSVSCTCDHCGARGEVQVLPHLSENNYTPCSFSETFDKLLERGWRVLWRKSFCAEPECRAAGKAFSEQRMAEAAAKSQRLNAALDKAKRAWDDKLWVLGWHWHYAGVWQLEVRAKRDLQRLPTEFEGYPVTARIAMKRPAPYQAVTF